VNEYTASNGCAIKTGDRLPTDYIELTVEHSDDSDRLNTLLKPREWEALREFFRAEEDERLGRWRWPENEGYIVYPDARYPHLVTVIDESTGLREFRSKSKAGHKRDNFERAAAAYFDAHREPKPWHDAKFGEVWLLTFTGFETHGSSPWTVRPGRLTTDAAEFIYPQNGNTIALNDTEITAARRIYPEGDA
jgi:hypothetical protein